jgi:trigger factor
MKVDITSSKGLQSNLSVIVTKKELDKKIEERLHEVRNTVNLKGFRPGKVPVDILKKQFGKALHAEVLEKVIQESTYQALQDKNIKPAYQPKIEIKSVDEGKDLEFTIEVEQMPNIKLASLDKINITKYEIKVDEKDVNKRISDLAENSKKYIEVDKNKESKKNDLVEFNYVAQVDGKDFENNKGDKIQIILGKDLFIEGFDKNLIGVKIGDKKEFKIKLPENYPDKNIAGKASSFKCEILNIKTPQEQKIDDEFAKSLGTKDLNELKNMIEKQATKEFDLVTNQLIKKQILDSFDNEKEYKFDLPKVLLDEEINNIEHMMIHEKMNISCEDHDKVKLEDKDKNEAKKLALRRVKLALIINKIADENKIKVTPQELQRELENQLRNYPGQEKKIREYYQKNPGELTKLSGPIFEDKVIDFVKTKVKYLNKTVTKEELQTIFDGDNKETNKKSKSKSSKK